MPKLVYKPRRDLPLAVKALETTSPTAISEWILSRFNEVRTPESITMWLKRHPDVAKELEAYVKSVAKVEVKEAVRESTFDRVVFEKLPSVDNWIRDCRRRESVKAKTLSRYVASLNQFCRGEMPLVDANKQISKREYIARGYPKEEFKPIDLKEYGWTFKHPDRLTLKDVEDYLDLMKEHFPDVDTCSARIALRNFLSSKNINVKFKISGKKHKGTGKYARLYVEIGACYNMLEYIKEVNYEAYVCNHFMFKTGTRHEATLDAALEELRMIEGHLFITVYDKGSSSKYGDKGHPWDKYIPPVLMSEIKLLTGYPEKITGKLFPNVTEEINRDLNRQALEKYAPELLERYPLLMVVHFWRHMFAQHMLRVTGWNYAVVANLGGWDVSSLEESYGKPPLAMIREWGIKQLPRIERNENISSQVELPVIER